MSEVDLEAVRGFSMNREDEYKKHSEQEMVKFLRLLDESETLEVSEWEAGFINDLLPRLEKFPLTDGQKRVIETLIIRYGHRLRGW
jgi:hypothetical protein